MLTQIPDGLSKSYHPGQLLDALAKRLILSSDAELGRFLDVQASRLSKMRHSQCELSAAFLIRAHEATGMQISEMRRICGDRRLKFRV